MKYTGFVAMGRKDPKSRILTFFFYMKKTKGNTSKIKVHVGK